MSEKKVWIGPAILVAEGWKAHGNEARVVAKLTEGEGRPVSIAGDIGEAIVRWREQGATHVIAYDRRLGGSVVHRMGILRAGREVGVG